ncbi:unnamed protein product [Adineta ricciae]|uniref:Uncharacterized protein n=1 Tax=Adineta ricciae TaxID=249248 RepID=A0A814LFQ4_ADIRI|nr:unnamed protein product [Adineta ricciae]CAF1397357.1 unnamed protein product [Adineta ricciae]
MRDADGNSIVFQACFVEFPLFRFGLVSHCLKKKNKKLMHLSWPTNLFICFLLSLFIAINADLEYPEDYIDKTTRKIDQSKTRKMLHHDVPGYDHGPEIYSDESNEDSEGLPQTAISTSTTTKTTTTEYEITEAYGTLSTTDFAELIPDLSIVTGDSVEIDAYLRRTNRERLMLKIFAIVMITAMISLTIILLTLFCIRKKRRYDGYNLPQNQPSSKA